MPVAERRDTRRRFEQWARNPDCMANTISAVHGIPMEKVAEAEGLPRTMGQSPFAMARGQGFERTLFENDAARLREELVRAGLLPDPTGAFRDLRLRRLGGECSDLDAALAATQLQLKEAASATRAASAPVIVAGATISVPGGGMLPEAILVVDVLLIRFQTTGPELMVGEIKTYPDRGGYTDGVELATARAQAGVYVHGIEIVLASLGLDEQMTASKEGFLVLSRPGFNVPSIRAGEDLRYQVERARRGLTRLREVAATALIDGDGIEAVRHAPCSYGEACLSFCDRASGCYGRAVGDADPIVLGEDVRRFLGPISLERACELLGGARPSGEAERDVARRMEEIRSLVPT
jgi:hypothetical protein